MLLSSESVAYVPKLYIIHYEVFSAQLYVSVCKLISLFTCVTTATKKLIDILFCQALNLLIVDRPLVFFRKLLFGFSATAQSMPLAFI